MVVQQVYDEFPDSLNTTILETDTKKSISLTVIDTVVDDVTIKSLKHTSIDTTNTASPITIDNYMTIDELRSYIRILQEICRNMY